MLAPHFLANPAPADRPGGMIFAAPLSTQPGGPRTRWRSAATGAREVGQLHERANDAPAERVPPRPTAAASTPGGTPVAGMSRGALAPRRTSTPTTPEAYPMRSPIC